MIEEFISFIQYARSLQFEEKPDYGYLRSLLMNLMNKKGYTNDYVYDWINDNTNTIVEEEKKESNFEVTK